MMGDQRPPGTSAAYDRVPSIFGSGTAQFGVSNIDRERVADYLLAALKTHLTWDQAEADIRACLTAQGATPDRIDDQVDLIRPLLQPWLK
jgi:hypothetical protein